MPPGTISPSGSIGPLPPEFSSVSVSDNSISLNESSDLTALISNMLSSDNVFAKINSKFFQLTSTDGFTWTKTLNGVDIGAITSGTLTVYAINTTSAAWQSTTLTVTTPTIASSTFQHDILIYIRDLLAANITDPASAKRTGTYANSKFVMTSWPERNVVYPLITCEIFKGTNEPTGTYTVSTIEDVRLRISVWARDTKTRDTLADSVHNVLRTKQISDTVVNGLFEFRLVSENNMDEPGEQGIHRKILLFKYIYIT